MTDGLRAIWELRNAAAATLIKTEEQLRRALQFATTEELVALLETFSPARSPGPDWTRSLDPLVERIWMWCDAQTIAGAEADFRGRGPAWAAVANALVPERGEALRRRLNHPAAGARMPAFTLI